MRGCKGYTRQQLADEFEKLKMNGDIYHFDTTRDNLPAALALVAKVLKEPEFTDSEFEQLRNETLVALEATRNDPKAIAEQEIGMHFNQYPTGDWRDNQTIDEQIAEVKATKLDDVKAFYQQFYGASHGEVAIVGDFDAAQAAHIVSDTLGSWNSQASYALIKTEFAAIAPEHKSIDAADKENGYYSARLNLDLADTDADYAALSVANYIFGGGAGLDSRLMNRIRNKDGLSYGGESSIDAGSIDRAGSFTINAIAAPQNLKKVDADVRDELQRILKDGFTAQEVARAKSGMLQQRMQIRAHDNALAAGWMTYLYLGRTYAWSKEFEDKVNALTAEQVNAAFRKVIDPAKMTVVMAGDMKKAKR
jgi:zinc protease